MNEVAEAFGCTPAVVRKNLARSERVMRGFLDGAPSEGSER